MTFRSRLAFRHRIGQWLPAFLLTVAAALALPHAAQAQVKAGVRGGLSIDPDQVYFGGHVETAPLIDRLRFRPNVEIGVGDDVTVAAFNFEFAYHFASRKPWGVYAGAGPGVNFVRSNGNSNSQAGFNLLAGATRSDGLFFEGKIGLGDSPSVKFGVGYTFK